MRIEKTISLPAWDGPTKQKAIRFWSERRVVFNNTSGEPLIGKRGSVWGNLTSFDMSKLITTVTISQTSSTQIQCVLDVNTIMQTVTEWNKAYWELELKTFESFLLKEDRKEEVWKRFLEADRNASWDWALSLGHEGRVMPKGDLQDKVREVSRGDSQK